jgi:hypothetical protein
MLFQMILSSIRAAIAKAVAKSVGGAVKAGVAQGLKEGFADSFEGMTFPEPVETQLQAAIATVPSLTGAEEHAEQVLLADEPDVKSKKSAKKGRK